MACGGVFKVDYEYSMERVQKLETRLDAIERGHWRLPEISWQGVFVPAVVGISTYLGTRIANKISKGDDNARPNYPGDSLVGGVLGALAGVVVATVFVELPSVGRAGMVAIFASGVYAHYRG